MKSKLFYILFVSAFAISLCGSSFAEMSSANFTITTSVVSGGGAPGASTNFQTNSTLGQPSPLMDPSDPPLSTNYNLEPGFWYTVAVAEVCECDLNNDGSCNILDWPYFIEDWGRTDCNDPGVDCECDMNGDGSCNILDWPYFIEDWGRTDCP